MVLEHQTTRCSICVFIFKELDLRQKYISYSTSRSFPWTARLGNWGSIAHQPSHADARTTCQRIHEISRSADAQAWGPKHPSLGSCPDVVYRPCLSGAKYTAACWMVKWLWGLFAKLWFNRAYCTFDSRVDVINRRKIYVWHYHRRRLQRIIQNERIMFLFYTFILH